jgi:hypothetical protein
MGVTADGKIDIVGYGQLDHSGLIIDNVLGGNYDLVDVFFVNLLARPEPLDHVINELLCHLIAKAYSVVIGFDFNRIQIKTFRRGRFITNVDSGIKILLAHNPLALSELELSIFIVRVELNTFLEILHGIFRLEDSSIGYRAAEVSLRE